MKSSCLLDSFKTVDDIFTVWNCFFYSILKIITIFPYNLLLIDMIRVYLRIFNNFRWWDHLWRFFFNELFLRFWWSLKYIGLFGNWELLFGMSFFCLTVVSVLILGWYASILLSYYGAFCRLSRFLLFLVIKNVHKLLENFLVLNVHTGIHMLIIFLQLLFCLIIGSCRVFDI